VFFLTEIATVNKVSILISTYNGAEHLKEQVDSLYTQTYSTIEIIARDDGSSDATMSILKSYNIKMLDIKENLGAKRSFGELLNYAVANSDSDYFMFCDQDDVWKNDKIEKTILKMQEMEKELPKEPILIHTDLEVVDENLNNMDTSMWHYEYLNPELNSFNRLLMQNTITGCTVMVNKRLAQLALPIPNEVIMHDWWLGLVASKFGRIGYLDEATIKYRQHNSNSIGAKGFSYSLILLKFYTIFCKNELHIKHLHVKVKQAEAFLDAYKDNLDINTIEMLEDYVSIEQKSFWGKRVILTRYKLLKQGFLRNLGLLLKI